MENTVLVIILILVMAGLYFVKRKFLDAKIGKIVGAIIWCAPFVIYSIIIKETGFRWVEQTYSCVVYIIIGLVLEAVMITYTNQTIPKTASEKIYNFFVRPITSESVFMGVLVPALFGVRIFAQFFMGNDLFFLNLAMIVAVVLYTAVEIHETEDGMDLLQIVVTIALAYVHTVILCRTGVIWFNLVLRLVYGVIRLLKKDNRPTV